MTEDEQASLEAFDSGTADRPVEAEAAAVAGGDRNDAEVVDAREFRYPDADGHVTLSVTQVNYTVEGSGGDEYPVIHVFGRTEERDLVHVRVYEFRPYFYAPTADLDFEDLETRDRITGWESGFESIRGEDLTKIYGQTPRDVGAIRDEFDHYEADILFPNRLLIDKDITSGIRVPARWTDGGSIRLPHDEIEPVDATVEPRVSTFDIEVDDRSGFPEDGEERIICIASHDSYSDEYVLWLVDAGEGAGVPERLDGYDPLEEDFEADIRVFEDEPAMLDAFVGYVEATDPDILTGWNFTDFDAPYLLDRLEVVDPTADQDLSIERLSRVDEVWRNNWQGPNIKGRVVFDLLRAYKRTQFTELESYRLEAVGETELGAGKETYTGDIGDLWEDDPERLLEYNLRDVELCVELDRKQEIIAFFQEIASFVGCKLEDAPTPGDAVDMYVLHKAHGRFVLPSKGTVEAGEEFEGGAVFDPITGVREMVSVLDLKCFSADTEVMTPTGPRSITDVEVGEEVYTLDPDTFECEIKPVVDTQSYDNRYGELHHLSGNTHDFKITENHRVLASAARGWDEQTPEDFEFAAYRDVPDYGRFAFPQHEPMDGRRPSTFDLVDEVDGGHAVVYYNADLRSFRGQMPVEVQDHLELIRGSSERMGIEDKVGKYLIPLAVYRDHRSVIEEHADATFLKYDSGHRETPTEVEMADWLELLGWFVTEGSLDHTNGRVVIHQKTDTHREAISELLDSLELNHSVDDAGVYVSNRYLYEWLEDNCGDGYEDKHLPEWVFDLDSDLLGIVLETMIRGDGSRADSGLRKLWTKSDQLKDDILRLAVRSGHKPTVSKQSDGTWYVSIGKRGSFKKENASVEDHEGRVHCLTAKDNHVVLAGRNGHFQWIGQSLYPMCMVTINASPETKVDPNAYDGETYVAPNGQHFRQEPDGIIREMVTELLSEREEKKELRNKHDPGSEAYEQYDRQQASVKVVMNCFTPDTEVLTPDGVRNIRDLTVGDEVYSLDPNTLEMERKPVVETHAYPDYDGELVDIRTSKVDFRVTPNHRMLVRKDETNGISWDPEEYRFVEAGDLDRATNYQLPHGWDGPSGQRIETVDLTQLCESEYEVWCDNEVHGHTLAAEIGYYPDKVKKNDEGTTGYVFTASEFEKHREYLDGVCSNFYVHLEANRKWIPRFYDGDDFLELLAWYVTEGSVYTSEEKAFGEKLRGSATTVQIAQEATTLSDGGQSDHATIGDLLDRMGLDYYANERSYQFTSRLLGRLLEDIAGEDSFSKRIPELVFEASQPQKRRFLETLIDGDGDRQPNSWRYSTASEGLRDDVLRLCAHLGLTASCNEDSGTHRVYVTEDPKNTVRMHRSGSRSHAEDGVYCVTVADNNTLLAGRNGKFQWVGQSLYGVSGWDRFRLYDKDNAAAVTATGRAVIDHTEDAVDELNYQVTYGDTDSVMISLGVDTTIEEAIETSFEIEEAINTSYDEFAREKLNAEEHRFQIEFEKLYRRFFQAGKKKRYAGLKVWVR